MSLPRTAFLGANPGRWRSGEPGEQFVNTNGVEAWAHALRGEYIGAPFPHPDELAKFELVIANTVHRLVPEYEQFIKIKVKAQKWVALIEGDGMDYTRLVPRLSSFLDRCDLVININPYSTPLIRALTKTPVEEFGIPYPVEAMRAKRIPPSEREREILICPSHAREPSILAAEAAAKDSSAKLRLYVPKVSRKWSNRGLFLKAASLDRDILAKAMQKRLPDAVVELEKELPEFWADAARCAVWMNLDPRYTWGRYVLDAAALGVPIVTTRSTGHGPELFPETTVEKVFEVEKAAQIAKRLLSDPDFARKVSAYADAKLDAFSYENAKSRLLTRLGY